MSCELVRPFPFSCRDLQVVGACRLGARGRVRPAGGRDAGHWMCCRLCGQSESLHGGATEKSSVKPQAATCTVYRGHQGCFCRLGPAFLAGKFGCYDRFFLLLLASMLFPFSNPKAKANEDDQIPESAFDRLFGGGGLFL